MGAELDYGVGKYRYTAALSGNNRRKQFDGTINISKDYTFVVVVNEKINSQFVFLGTINGHFEETNRLSFLVTLDDFVNEKSEENNLLLVKNLYLRRTMFNDFSGSYAAFAPFAQKCDLEKETAAVSTSGKGYLLDFTLKKM
jgi:hypothetical protein